jgi:acetylornithine/N-succinyldiaminopimelate aminotransferase
MNHRSLFLQHVAQTSPAPLALHIVKAEGAQLFDADGKSYIDLIGGISVANTGHRHPKVVAAIKEQADKYLHIMVYGELVQTPQVAFASLLVQHLPASLNSVYFTNSGAEAVEGAMKLAKRATGRTGIICCDHAYHGSTQGALSLIGDEYFRAAYRPLLPGICRIRFNNFDDLSLIDNNTACVIVETVQGEAGVIAPQKEWLQALRARCNETGALLVFDEIQAGFGRTGALWGFAHFDIYPDILLLGKALGGGLPLGAFIAQRDTMMLLTDAPVLGHITTFGGHPLCCAAGMAAMQVLLEEGLMNEVAAKEQLFHQLLVHPRIKGISAFGLWMAVALEDAAACKKVIDHCIEAGVFTDWFLFAPQCIRISPPLVITQDEIREACRVILEALDK